MRVALVVGRFDRGGVETHLLRLGSRLRRAGHFVEVVASEQPGHWFGRIRRGGLRARALDVRASRTAAVHARRLARVLARFDAVVLNHARLVQAILALLPDSVVAVPVIHNDLEAVYATACANPRAWNVAVGVGPGVAEGTRRRAPGRPVEEIRYGVEAPPPDAGRVDPAKRPLRLLFAGRLAHEQKGVLLLPDVVAALKRRGSAARLTVVGDGPDRGALAARAASLGVSDRFTFAGFVAPERMYERFREAHVLLLPSFFEGLCIALLEAMANGCVPVASRLSGVTDAVIVDGDSGFLAPVGDADVFAACVLGLEGRPDALARMSAHAIERVRTHFDVEVMAQRYERLLLDACAGRYPLPGPRRDLPPIDRTLLGADDFRPQTVRSRLRYRVGTILGRPV